MSQGWISLHRQILEWGWYRDVNTKSLFIHLLLKANHEAGKWQGLDIQRGQLVTGRKRLSEETGMSEQEIRTSINKLKSTSEIAIISTNKYSIVTIVNYDVFQIGSTINQPTKQPAKHLTSNQQSTTNNNNNNENKKDTPAKLKAFSEDSSEYKLSLLLENMIRQSDEGFKKQDLQKWAVHIDRLIRLDNREDKQIHEVIVFAQSDPFWKTNILSTAKLRVKYTTLLMQMESKKQPTLKKTIYDD